ncbi:MAG: hypothetical protein QNJ60_18865 [Xenococcaceae cyanobacterium MO_188.B19]|nr:hypothetical protein [Xenococcaceae cyanobacterium MO_188.B19]
MLNQYFLSSLTRISDLDDLPFEIASLPRSQWATGDYVLGEVIPPLNPSSQVELTNGRMATLLPGDLIIGAFGVRQATLEIVGDWQDIPTDNSLHALTAAGLFGKATSVSHLLPSPPSLVYQGHVVRNGQKLSMDNFIINPLPEETYQCPTIMIIGTSMSAGKTTAARIIIRLLRQMGLKVIGAKLTGAGRYRDILAMKDAGAHQIFDFVDVGLPSSICEPEEFRQRLRQLLSKIAATKPDVVVAEAGASPLEPYNGAIVLEEMRSQINYTILCASDPYAVVGVSQGFGLHPDLITGVATSTSAGVQLVEKLTGIKALTLPEPKSWQQLKNLLLKALFQNQPHPIFENQN